MKEANIKANESNLGHLIDSIGRNLRAHNKEKESNCNAPDKSKVKNNLIKSQEFIVQTEQKEITVLDATVTTLNLTPNINASTC